MIARFLAAGSLLLIVSLVSGCNDATNSGATTGAVTNAPAPPAPPTGGPTRELKGVEVQRARTPIK